MKLKKRKSIEETNEARTSFLGKDHISLVRLGKKKRKIQITNSTSERVDISIDPMDIKRITKEYY